MEHRPLQYTRSSLSFHRLSGESPFQGNSDTETLAQVTAACYKFDEDSFEDISDQAKYFIDSLLKKDIRLVPLLEC